MSSTIVSMFLIVYIAKLNGSFNEIFEVLRSFPITYADRKNYENLIEAANLILISPQRYEKLKTMYELQFNVFLQ